MREDTPTLLKTSRGAFWNTWPKFGDLLKALKAPLNTFFFALHPFGTVIDRIKIPPGVAGEAEAHLILLFFDWKKHTHIIAAILAFSSLEKRGLSDGRGDGQMIPDNGTVNVDFPVALRSNFGEFVNTRPKLGDRVSAVKALLKTVWLAEQPEGRLIISTKLFCDILATAVAQGTPWLMNEQMQISRAIAIFSATVLLGLKLGSGGVQSITSKRTKGNVRVETTLLRSRTGDFLKTFRKLGDLLKALNALENTLFLTGHPTGVMIVRTKLKPITAGEAEAHRIFLDWKKHTQMRVAISAFRCGVFPEPRIGRGCGHIIPDRGTVRVEVPSGLKSRLGRLMKTVLNPLELDRASKAPSNTDMGGSQRGGRLMDKTKLFPDMAADAVAQGNPLAMKKHTHIIRAISALRVALLLELIVGRGTGQTNLGFNGTVRVEVPGTL